MSNYLQILNRNYRFSFFPIISELHYYLSFYDSSVLFHDWYIADSKKYSKRIKPIYVSFLLVPIYRKYKHASLCSRVNKHKRRHFVYVFIQFCCKCSTLKDNSLYQCWTTMQSLILWLVITAFVTYNDTNAIQFISYP